MEQVTISLNAYLKEQVEARLDLWDMTWEEFIENAMNDPFYAEKNQSRIQDSIAQIEEGRVVKKTMAELFQNYEDDYQGESYDWGSPVGKEKW